MNIEDQLFFEKLREKVLKNHNNAKLEPFHPPIVQFTNCKITKGDFKKLLEIIEGELLIVIPNVTGFITALAGYHVFDLKGKFIFSFSENNIPEGFTLKGLFYSLFMGQQNLELLSYLKEEGKFHMEFYESFDEYCPQ